MIVSSLEKRRLFTISGPLQRGFLSFIRTSQEAHIISDSDELYGCLVKEVTNVQLMVFWRRSQAQPGKGDSIVFHFIEMVSIYFIL